MSGSDLLEAATSPGTFLAVAVLSGFSSIPPTSLVNLAAGTLHGVFFGSFLYLIGTTIGGLGTLLVVRILRDVLLRQECMLKHKDTWEAFDAAIEAEGPLKLVTLLRLSPAMPFAPTSGLLGLTRVPLLQFCVGTFGGLAPFTVVYSYVGTVGREMVTGNLLDDPLQLSMTLFGLVATIYVTYRIGVMASVALATAQGQRNAMV